MGLCHLIAGHTMLTRVIDARLQPRAALWRECVALHGQRLAVACRDAVCHHPMSGPGVGALVALAV